MRSGRRRISLEVPVDCDLLDRIRARRLFWLEERFVLPEPPKHPYGRALESVPDPEPVRARRRRKRRWRESPEVKAWVLAVKERDGCCVGCGSKERPLHAHHVDRAPELRAALENGLTLCVACHRLEHLDLPDRLFQAA